MRELRQGLAEVAEQVQSGGAVLAGPHRKPEVVVMSVRQYERLAAAEDAAVRSALGSMDMEGMPATAQEREALVELAAGRITREQYLARLLPEYYSKA